MENYIKIAEMWVRKNEIGNTMLSNLENCGFLKVKDDETDDEIKYIIITNNVN